MTVPESRPRQPLLNDGTVTLSAPTQVWSRENGDTSGPVDGIYHGDIRHVGTISIQCAQSEIEWISCVADSASEVTFGGLLRDADSDEADPKLRFLRHRQVEAGLVSEHLEIRSHLPQAVVLTLRVELGAAFTPLSQIKDGRLTDQPFTLEISNSGVCAQSGPASFCVTGPAASYLVEDSSVVLQWDIEIPAFGVWAGDWQIEMADSSLVVSPATTPWLDPHIELAEGDLGRWQRQAWSDLGALRMQLPGSGDQFLAAGAPWFFTLFGRDSLWAARLLLSAQPDLALSTLRVLARLQGREHNADTAEAPGKILHELRSATLEIPGEGVTLPPVYYGSVDSTLLWICLLGDAWKAGAASADIEPLIPALQAALHWMLFDADGDGDGFLDYIDQSGRGLSNQGWKDSGDSIQWRDGHLAAGPIALCEVQGYAYEAALLGAELLEAFPTPGKNSAATDFPATGGLGAEISVSDLRSWAEDLRIRFAENYWVETAEGRYPAIALDGSKRQVDTLTSNIGHLLGTGILSPEEEAIVAGLLTSPTMLSGFGVRTLSSEAAGYWPLSYHGGSVWAHDSAIIAWGMRRSGLNEAASLVAENLIRTAVGFDYRMPELHCGDSSTVTPGPTPYPAACRPQAWSAAAAFALS